MPISEHSEHWKCLVLADNKLEHGSLNRDGLDETREPVGSNYAVLCFHRLCMQDPATQADAPSHTARKIPCRIS